MFIHCGIYFIECQYIGCVSGDAILRPSLSDDLHFDIAWGMIKWLIIA